LILIRLLSRMEWSVMLVEYGMIMKKRNRQIICVPQKEKPDETVRQKSQRKMNLSAFLRIHISILEIRSSSPAESDIS